MSTSIRSVRFVGSDDESEQRRSEKGFRFRKELKQRKQAIKKMFREQTSERQRETEELELFLNFLSSMTLDMRRELIRRRNEYSLQIRAIFPNEEDYHEALNRALVARREGRADRTEFLVDGIPRLQISVVWQMMKQNQDYHTLDRFLQFLFVMADDALKLFLAGPRQRGNDEAIDINGLLRAIYPGELSQERQWEKFLRRNLRHSDLQRLDQADGNVPVDENQNANVAAMQRRVMGLQRFEDFVLL